MIQKMSRNDRSAFSAASALVALLSVPYFARLSHDAGGALLARQAG